MPKRKDITGQRFGYLVAVSPSHLNKYKHLLWTFLCDCGKYKEIPIQSVTNGRTKSCGCKQKELQNIHKIKSDKDSSCKSLMGDYRKGAIKRGYTFELNLEQFKSITSRNCFYCGRNPENVSLRKHKQSVIPYIYNGIDRVDNSRGYEIDNVVPCCFVCNRAKATLGQEEFVAWITRAYYHLSGDK